MLNEISSKLTRKKGDWIEKEEWKNETRRNVLNNNIYLTKMF